ncbi:MAG: amidohydrolase family protein [Alphaproteobacteria bacterium]|nr:amidohydrolase family protein [Alphaproteobacteria bacterium]
MIDGYAHLGLPRFWAVEDYRRIMELVGIRRAMVCPFDSCPDIAECHRALLADPAAFRAYGLVLGRDRREMEAGLLAQLEAGFDGFRLGDAKIAAHPWILDVLGREEAVPMVVGARGLAAAAPMLVAFLERYPRAVAVSAHFAGPTDPDVLRQPGPVRALFAHPRFLVVMSRQGMFPAPAIKTWAEALIDVVGWSRLMWGSEAPVPIWRDEKLALTPAWIDQFAPDPAQRAAFFSGNGERAVFDRPARPVRPLTLPFDPWDHEVKIAAPMFPYGLSADTRIPARLVQAWLAAGGETVMPLSAFLSAVLDKALPPARRGG